METGLSEGGLDDGRYRLLVDAITDYAIYMLDPEGGVTNWNAGAQRIKGYRPEEIVGQHFSRFYVEEDRQAGLPEHALETAARVGRFEKEGWRVRKDGSRFWAHVVIDVIRNPRGEVIGFAKITRDITERMETQRSLEAAREALFQSQKMEAIGQLTGGVAHDFNNLLMAVLGSLELVRKRLPYDARVTPLLDNAMQGAQRGAILTQRMLSFARKQELKLETVDLPSLVHGMTSFAERTIGPGITVDLRFPAGLPAARTDPYQLEAAILNLIVNARDAMPSGGTVTISADPESLTEARGELPAGDYVRLRVADTGEGMTPETLLRAAEPFYTTKGVGKGTGLGLSMAHGLAAQSGGAMFIGSTPGEGTQIDLWLPRATGEGASTSASDDAPAFEGGRRKLVILAVDDDHLVLTNTKAMLDDLGHEVLPASSAKDAQVLLGKRPDVDLVITDELMPGMRGSELAAIIRAGHPDLPVILTTGYAELLVGTQSIPGEWPRLAKPFTQAGLAEAVDDTVRASNLQK